MVAMGLKIFMPEGNIGLVRKLYSQSMTEFIEARVTAFLLDSDAELEKMGLSEDDLAALNMIRMKAGKAVFTDLTPEEKARADRIAKIGADNAIAVATAAVERKLAEDGFQ
jgi:hypothetical protein